MMGRPKQQQRKSIDEIYGPKSDINPIKVSGAQPTHIANRLHERRLQRESANSAAAAQVHGTRQWNSGPGIVGTARGTGAAAPAPAPTAVLPAGNCTYRRKTARQRSVEAKAIKEKTPEKEEKAVIIDKPKKEKSKQRSNHTSRADKNSTIRTHVAESTHHSQYIYTLDDIIQEQQFQQLHMQQTLKNKPQVQIYHRQIPAAQLQQKTSQLSSLKQAAFQQQSNPEESMYYHHPTHQEHQRQPTVQVVDEDKDEDTEEFFDLIKQTVESAIGKTVSDLLNRNFREVTTKIDQFAKDLNTTQTMITNMQSDVNGKICHYGEENSRHFRYLCMKSEYDKMFYQHHVLLNGNGGAMPGQPPKMPTPGMPVPEVPLPSSTVPAQQPVPAPTVAQTTVTPAPSSDSPRQTVPVMCSPNTTTSDIVNNPNAYQSANNAPAKPAQQVQQPEANAVPTPDPQNSLSTRSSEVHMREVLDHIQRFCVQMQGSDTFKVSPNTLKENSNFRPEGAMIINKDVFLDNDDEDIDDCMISSDGMTPRSMKQINRYDVKPMQFNVHGAGDS